ncbi:hypothetical protein HanPSC8_Chr06g0242161 [Helianthus annuus]|nr:hypothetical protein HanPSC8_Chr06g0242161 [Helianthus annuus]
MQQVAMDYKVQPKKVQGSCLTMSEVHNLTQMQWSPHKVLPKTQIQSNSSQLTRCS